MCSFLEFHLFKKQQSSGQLVRFLQERRGVGISFQCAIVGCGPDMEAQVRYPMNQSVVAILILT